MTRRGWWLAATALLMALAGGVLGIEELDALAAAAVALLLTSWCWVHTRTWEVRTDRVVHPLRVAAGQTAQIELIATNRHGRRSPLLVAEDPSDESRQVATFSLAPLDPGGSARASYPLTTRRRGMITIGPLRLSVSDPFGLTRRMEVGANASSLIVHPCVEPVLLPASFVTPDPLPATANAMVVGSGDEFQGLREYAVGDDLRRVHWLSTARRDELMIRQEERPGRGRLLVVVDLRAALHSPSSLEAIVGAAASIFDAGIRQHLAVRLVTTAGLDTGFGESHAHRTATLDRLASAQPDPSLQLAALPRALAATPESSFVVLSTDGASSDDLTTLTRVPGARHVGVILVQRRSPSSGRRGDSRRAGPVAELAGGRAEWTILLPPGGSLTDAWHPPGGRTGRARQGAPGNGWREGNAHASN